MLAEIFLLRLEAMARAEAPNGSRQLRDPRFVPVAPARR